MTHIFLVSLPKSLPLPSKGSGVPEFFTFQKCRLQLVGRCANIITNRAFTENYWLLKSIDQLFHMNRYIKPFN